MATQPEDYTVGWICTTRLDSLMACGVLDGEYTGVQKPKFTSPGDLNTYKFGYIGGHNIVIMLLQHNPYGMNSMAIAILHMQSTFPEIRFGLSVGTAGGAPNSQHDIRLGDVVVGFSASGRGSVVQYSFGKTMRDHELAETGRLTPPLELQIPLQHLASQPDSVELRLDKIIEDLLRDKFSELRLFNRPVAKSDELYEESSDGQEQLVSRQERSSEKRTIVHYGLIASANQLMNDSKTRDALATRDEILCFETGSAGMTDDFPCLFIRGICNYSDKHKNDENEEWQRYATVSAACLAKIVISSIMIKKVELVDIANDVDKQLGNSRLDVQSNINDSSLSMRPTDSNPKKSVNGRPLKSLHDNDDSKTAKASIWKPSKTTLKRKRHDSDQSVEFQENKADIPTISLEEDWGVHPRKLNMIKSEIRSTIERLSCFSEGSASSLRMPNCYPGQSWIGQSLEPCFSSGSRDLSKLLNGPRASQIEKAGTYQQSVMFCHRRSAWIALTLIYLQKTRFVSDTITILVQAESTEKVADVVSLATEEVFDVLEGFDRLLNAVPLESPKKYSMNENSTDRYLMDVHDMEVDLLHKCRQILERCTKRFGSQTSDWVQTLDILELAIFCHSHAHRMSLLSKNSNFIRAVESTPDPGLSLQLCQTSCLSEFFAGDELLVLNTDFFQANAIGLYTQAPIIIRTTISNFDSIWGPVYKVIEDGKIIQYNVGRGCIVPWFVNEPQRVYGNKGVNCHWVPYNLMRESCLFDQAPQSDHTNGNSLSSTTEDDHQSVDTGNITPENEHSFSEQEDTTTFSENNPYHDGGSNCHIDGGNFEIYEDVNVAVANDNLLVRAQYAREHPFLAEDILVIGALGPGKGIVLEHPTLKPVGKALTLDNLLDTGPVEEHLCSKDEFGIDTFRQCSTALRQFPCTCSNRTFRGRHVQRNLETREQKTTFKRGPFGVSIGWSGSSIRQNFLPVPNDRSYVEILLDRWEHHPALCHPQQLLVLGGVKVSSCTGNAIRCSILELFKTPAMRRIIQQMATSSIMSRAMSSCGDLFLKDNMSTVLQEWASSPTLRPSIHAIILECITLLASTGLDKVRSSFNALWVPQHSTIPRRIVLNSKNHDWSNLLQNSTETCAFSVLVEECYSLTIEDQRVQFCGRHNNQPLRSVLQTNIVFDSELPPFSDNRLGKHKIEADKQDSPIELSSGFYSPPPSSQIWLQDPFERLALVKIMGPHHIVVQWSPSMSQKMLNAVFFDPITGRGHREAFEVEDQTKDATLVHVRHSRAADTKQKKSESTLQTVLRMI